MPHLPQWVVEGHCVYDVGVLIEGEQFLTWVCVPYFTSAVVAACDKLATIFIERTVGQGQQVRAQYFKQAEALLLVFHLLFN